MGVPVNRGHFDMLHQDSAHFSDEINCSQSTLDSASNKLENPCAHQPSSIQPMVYQQHPAEPPLPFNFHHNPHLTPRIPRKK